MLNGDITELPKCGKSEKANFWEGGVYLNIKWSTICTWKYFSFNYLFVQSWNCGVAYTLGSMVI